MKMTIRPGTNEFVFISETPADLYKLGVLSQKLKGAHINNLPNEQKELTADIPAVLEALLK